MLMYKTLAQLMHNSYNTLATKALTNTSHGDDNMLFSLTPQLLTKASAAAYVNSYNAQGNDRRVLSVKMTRPHGVRTAVVTAEGTSQEDGETFVTTWWGWEEVERLHPTGLYGEW